MNIYLTDPIEGGETIIFDHIWETVSEVEEGSYAIPADYPEKARFNVKPGRLVLFNSRNLHTVLPSKNERIALGGLVGLTKDGEILLWA